MNWQVEGRCSRRFSYSMSSIGTRMWLTPDSGDSAGIGSGHTERIWVIRRSDKVREERAARIFPRKSRLSMMASMFRQPIWTPEKSKGTSSFPTKLMAGSNCSCTPSRLGWRGERKAVHFGFPPLRLHNGVAYSWVLSTRFPNQCRNKSKWWCGCKTIRLKLAMKSRKFWPGFHIILVEDFRDIWRSYGGAVITILDAIARKYTTSES